MRNISGYGHKVNMVREIVAAEEQKLEKVEAEVASKRGVFTSWERYVECLKKEWEFQHAIMKLLRNKVG